MGTACVVFYVVSVILFAFSMMCVSMMDDLQKQKNTIAAAVILAFACGIFFGWALWLTLKNIGV